MEEQGKAETLEIKAADTNHEDQGSPRGVLECSPALGNPDSDHSSSSSGCALCPWPPPPAPEDHGEGDPSLGKSPGIPTSKGRDRNRQGIYWRGVMDALRRKSTTKYLTDGRDATRLGNDIKPEKKSEKMTTTKKKKLVRIRSAEEGSSAGVACVSLGASPKPSWRNFDHAELAAATRNFSPDNLIGKGGHAEVFKGTLPDGQIIAVKRLIDKKRNESREDDNHDDIRTADFLSELGIIAHIDHPNAAKLLGFGVDGGLHLVLQFSHHGSLASVLHGSADYVLGWKTRFEIALGVALGLQYLHCGCQRRIIHRDIKASNILLTEDYQPQISDFGLAKWLPEKWAQHVVFPIEGTFGYLAPEYFMHGIVDEKVDVFAFGVLLLELITGRRAIDSSRQSLVMWAKPLLDSNELEQLADPRLEGSYELGEMERVATTASICIHYLSAMRPDMNRVVQMLKGENVAVEWKHKSVSGRALLLDACDVEDYTSSTYLEDLNRHMRLALE
ncbi:hypothetical protein MLD38_028499 [Melastoma candidum]|uniref:Uncharacterized protein n=1 Tax=Melastoma candidum TaxID=119954 RepID=A0ACB9N2Z6_9MYRT|nr:hypothetical protein MLD38_028499 [Melastoma candidum]